jgi:hypothetical protein
MVAFFNSRSNPAGRVAALQNAVDSGLDAAAIEIFAACCSEVWGL